MVKESHDRNAHPELRSRLLDALRSHRRRRSRRLEVYLRALWVLARGHASAEPRWDQIGEWLVTALTARPALFDEAWLRSRDPPEAGEGSPREEFDATLLFQIADLRRMQGGALEDEWGDFGVDSPTGNSWYNFEPLATSSAPSQESLPTKLMGILSRPAGGPSRGSWSSGGYTNRRAVLN